MNNAARRWLQTIVHRYGRGVLHDPRRCRALLMDFCGACRGEINVLEMALRENVVRDLEQASPHVPKALLFARLERRLSDAYYLPPSAARWAVESCALALDIVPPDEASRALVSDLALSVHARPWLASDDAWELLGKTPGHVTVPGNREVRVRAYITDAQAPVLARALAAFGPLQVLDLSYSPLGDEGLGELSVVTGLRELNLSRTGMTDQGLASLAGQEDLQRIELWGCDRVTGVGLRHLSGLQALAHLDLGRCEALNDAGLRSLPLLAELESVCIAGTAISDVGLGYAGTLPRLGELDISETEHVTGSGLAPLRQATGLRTLTCHRCVSLRPEHLMYLRDLPRLTDLDLGACGLLTDQALVHLRRLRTLTGLGLEGLSISDAGMLYLSELVTLTHLDLSWTPIGDEGLARLAPLVGLRELMLAGTAITDAGVRYLSRFPDLGHLDLANTRIGLAGLRSLVRMAPNLRSLDLEATAIDEANLSYVAALPHLSHLYLAGTGTGDAGLMALAGSGSLEYVDVTLCPRVTETGVATMTERGVTVVH